jgi:hypothetical protein
MIWKFYDRHISTSIMRMKVSFRNAVFREETHLHLLLFISLFIRAAGFMGFVRSNEDSFSTSMAIVTFTLSSPLEAILYIYERSDTVIAYIPAAH